MADARSEENLWNWIWNTLVLYMVPSVLVWGSRAKICRCRRAVLPFASEKFTEQIIASAYTPLHLPIYQTGKSKLTRFCGRKCFFLDIEHAILATLPKTVCWKTEMLGSISGKTHKIPEKCLPNSLSGWKESDFGEKLPENCSISEVFAWGTNLFEFDIIFLEKNSYFLKKFLWTHKRHFDNVAKILLIQVRVLSAHKPKIAHRKAVNFAALPLLLFSQNLPIGSQVQVLILLNDETHFSSYLRESRWTSFCSKEAFQIRHLFFIAFQYENPKKAEGY